MIEPKITFQIIKNQSLSQEELKKTKKYIDEINPKEENKIVSEVKAEKADEVKVEEVKVEEVKVEKFKVEEVITFESTKATKKRVSKKKK